MTPCSLVEVYDVSEEAASNCIRN